MRFFFDNNLDKSREHQFAHTSGLPFVLMYINYHDTLVSILFPKMILKLVCKSKTTNNLPSKECCKQLEVIAARNTK